MTDEIVTLSGGEAQHTSTSISAGPQGAVDGEAGTMNQNAGPAPTAAGGGASPRADHPALGAESAGDPPLGGVVHAR